MRLRGAPIPPRFPELGRDARRVALENGLVLFLRPDRRLPLVQFEALVRVGERYEKPEEYGVAGLLGTMLRTGGTEQWKPQDLDDRLAFLAANLNVAVGEESGSVSLDLLSKDAEEGLSIFAEVVRRPAFDEGRLALARRRAVNGILHRNDNPGQILDRELSALFYPEAHPAGRSLTPARLAAATRDRIRDFYGRHFRPENVRIALVGDFDEEAMLAKARERFGDWPRGGEPLGPPPKFEPKAHPGLFLVDKEVNQSSIAVAHPGIDRDNPDRHAVALMNAILGGGSFSSRITERVRSDEGLAYSARSSFPTGGREPEPFQATVQTKTATTARAIALLEEEIRKMQAGPISKNEFDTARESALYGMVFRNDRPVEAVRRLMRLEFDGLQADQDRRDFEGVSAVTPEAVVTAAKRYLRPDALTIFVVGEGKAIEADLAARGEPTRVAPAEYDFASFRDAGFAPGK
jgi:predicted Zn-dependent peptidase